MPIVTVTFFPCNICPGDICPYKQYFSCYWPNSDQTLRVVPGTLDFNCNGHICPGNIGPGKICPYEEYFSCYWPDFDKKFWTQFLEVVIYFDQNFWTKFCLTESFLDLQIFLETKFKKIWTQNFFRSKNFVNPKFCWPIILLDPNFFGPTFFGTWFLSWPKLFWTKSFCTQNFAYICFD